MSNFLKCDRIVKVDDDLGLVIGWGLICKQGGEDYFDLQGDNVPEDSMLEAVTEFALSDRIGGDMHKTADGIVVHSFPLTTDIAKALGIVCEISGWMIAMKPSPEVLQKFKTGEYTGFSIGGKYLVNEPVE